MRPRHSSHLQGEGIRLTPYNFSRERTMKTTTSVAAGAGVKMDPNG